MAKKDMLEIFTLQKNTYLNNAMPTAETRIEKLKKLKQATKKYKDELGDAISEDFSFRSKDETIMLEIIATIKDCDYAIKHTKKWMKPSKKQVDIAFKPAKNYVHYQPLGVVGIIVPWNFPLYMTTSPLICALAAGNNVMIKMSEYTPKTNKIITKMMNETFEESEVAIIEGDASIAQQFTALPFDHMLFTGSTNVGRHVMSAAAKNLTPVTLELGGKSPVVIGSDASIKDAVSSICYGKSINSGQTCIAPDYVLIPYHKEQEFIRTYIDTFSNMYPSLKNNKDYSAIINKTQHERLINLLKDAKGKGAELITINPANEDLSTTRKFAPVLVQNISEDMDVVREEIFGPILPILTYQDFREAINYINQRNRPLALYYFGHNKDEQTMIINHTHSGGVSINDTLKHAVQDDMPFGGIGDSGMGHYHGHYGFLTFSKSKAVYKASRINLSKHLFPPYDQKPLVQFMKKLATDKKKK